MARTASSPEQKAMLERMAATWESLAKDREETLARRRRIAALERGQLAGGTGDPSDDLS